MNTLILLLTPVSVLLGSFVTCWVIYSAVEELKDFLRNL